MTESSLHRRTDQPAQWRESLSKQAAFPILPTRHHLGTTTQTFTVCVLTHTRSVAAAHDKRTDDWASPEHFHRYAHRYATKVRAEIKGGSVKRERHASPVDKADKERERRRSAPSASERISDSTEHDKLASIATRSTAALAVDPVTDGRSLLHWQTSAATRSTATQTPNSVTDGRSLQQSRSTQGKYWLELQRLLYSIRKLVNRVGSRRPVPDRLSGTITGPHSIHLPGHARPQQQLLR